MPWTRGAVGTPAGAAENVGVNVPYPAGIKYGDILLLGVGYTNAAQHFINNAPRFKQRLSRAVLGTIALYTMRAFGAESGNINITTDSGGTNTIWGICWKYSGGTETVAATGSTGTTGLNLTYPAMSVAVNNCLIIGAGIKALNATAVDTPNPPFSSLVNFSHNAAPSCLVFEDDIQTVATNLTSSIWTLTGDASAAEGALTLALAAYITDFGVSGPRVTQSLTSPSGSLAYGVSGPYVTRDASVVEDLA